MILIVPKCNDLNSAQVQWEKSSCEGKHTNLNCSVLFCVSIFHIIL